MSVEFKSPLSEYNSSFGVEKLESEINIFLWEHPLRKMNKKNK